MNKRIHVVAGVIRDKDNKILIAKRPNHLHMGGLWEFPGGKVEPCESAIDALKRELKEEVGLTTLTAIPLIQIKHDYPDKQVYLDVWEVTDFIGEAKGLEEQEVKWVVQADLYEHEFPAANQTIVTAALLPPICLITGDANSLDEYLAPIEMAIDQGHRLFILRPPASNMLTVIDVCAAIKALRESHSVQWQWHIDWFESSDATLLADISSLENFGVHFSARKIAEIESYPCSAMLSASCHNLTELDVAQGRDIDFVLLSPVSKTKSYRDDQLLGWSGFETIVAGAKIPVFALGGLTQDDVNVARKVGGQGVACIRGWWG